MDNGIPKAAEKANVEKAAAPEPDDSKEDPKTQRALKRLQTTLLDGNVTEKSVKRLRSGPKDEGGPIIVRIIGGKCAGAENEQNESKTARASKETVKKELANTHQSRRTGRPQQRRSRSVTRDPRSRSVSQSSLSRSGSLEHVPLKRARLRSQSRGSYDRITPAQMGGEEEERKFCWICHRRDTQVDCRYCPRSFHTKCLSTTNMVDNMCPECAVCMKAETITYRAMEQKPLEKLRPLLQYTLDRMKNVEDSQHFLAPVSAIDHPEYKKVIRHPMDLGKLESNLRSDVYGSTAAFYADAKWIQHNSVIFNTNQAHLTSVARAMLKVCKQELEEIDKCPDCYMNAHNYDDWFIQVCRRPHILVWARLKGFPFWPAKILAVNVKQQNVDARFFGAHDRAWVPIKDCFLLSKSYPPSSCKKKGDIESALEEMKAHIAKIKEKLGSFVHAGDKVPYVPEIEDQQLSSMMPGWKPPTTRGKPVVEKEAREEEGVVADLDGICERELKIAASDTTQQRSDGKSEATGVTRTAEHGYSASAEVPTSNRESPKPVAKTPSSPKKKTVRPEAESNNKEKSPEKSTETSQQDLTRKISTEGEESNGTDVTTPVVTTKPKTIEIDKNRRPMVKMVDIIMNKAGPSHAEAGKPQLPDGVSFVVVPKKRVVGTERVVLNPMSAAAKPNKTKKPIPQAIALKDNAITISTSSAVPSKGPNHGVNIIAVDTKNSDAQRNLLKTLVANEDKSTKPTISVPPQREAQEGTSAATAPAGNTMPNSSIFLTPSGQAFTLTGSNVFTQTNNGLSLVQLNNLNLANEGTSSSFVSGQYVLAPNAASTSTAAPAPVPGLKPPQISVMKTLFPEDPIESEVKKHIPRLAENLHGALVEVLKSIGDNMPVIQQKMVSSQRDAEKRQHQKAIDDLRLEMEKKMKKTEVDCQRMLAEKQLEMEKLHDDYKRIIEQTKQKQWCALCRKEALFYCCWNTSYCNYPCQQQHWPSHMSGCSQISQNNSSHSPATLPNHQPRKKLVERNHQRITGGPSFDPASIAEVQLQSPPSVTSTYNGPAARKKL